MKDTGFFITDPEKLQLLAEPMPNDSDFRVGRKYTPERRGSGNPPAAAWFRPWRTSAGLRRCCSMAAHSTARQYLSPKAFELMTTDQIGPGSGVERDYFYFPGDGFGFGLGFGVRTDPGNAKPPPPGSLGELKWDGASGCYFVIDRKQDMFFVLLEQTPSERQRIQRQ